jgi:hypothetical protein
MTTFSNRDRFGWPQLLAALLLLVFLLQCAWLLSRKAGAGENDIPEIKTLMQGLSLWQGKRPGLAHAISNSESLDSSATLPSASAYDPDHSPLWYLIGSAPLLPWSKHIHTGIPNATLTWLAPIPSLFFGVMLGASLWYVSRRLYGNAGGYIALALYCFSPLILRSASLWLDPLEMGAAWSAFGTVFTAIAVAHTLYAPREVILWNWRRIILLGLSFALAVGSQFSLVALIPVALGLMLYVAPTRRRAALAIWTAACGIAALLIFASYAFRPSAFYLGMSHANFWPFLGRAFTMPGAYRQIADSLIDTGPAIIVTLPLAIITYTLWRRARFFGNTTPLLIALLCLLLGIADPHYPGLGFKLIAIPFLFVFISGVAADLLETKAKELLLPLFWSILTAGALWNLWQLSGARG